MNNNQKEYCSECGCLFKSKYMIRIDYTGLTDDENKRHFESTSKASVVGWIKHIMNEYTKDGFDDITIIDLLMNCSEHIKFYKLEEEKRE